MQSGVLLCKAESCHFQVCLSLSGSEISRPGGGPVSPDSAPKRFLLEPLPLRKSVKPLLLTGVGPARSVEGAGLRSGTGARGGAGLLFLDPGFAPRCLFVFKLTCIP